MRAHGVVDRPDQAAAGDHVCWVYATGESFAEAARHYFRAGLSRGDRLVWVGDDFAERVGLPGAATLVEQGALRLLPRSVSYEVAEAFARADQHAFYDAAMRQARDDGYTGLCVVAELTTTAADPTRRAELVRREHLADRFVAEGSGMSALCLYEGDRLPGDTVADLATVHAWARTPDVQPPFRIWFDGARLCLAGDVDTFTADRLASLLTTTPTGGASVVLDLSELEFVDVAGTRAVAQWARELNTVSVAVHLVDAPRCFHRVWHLLGFDQPPLASFAEPAP
jgi:anti-anti-sigma factor